MADVRALGCRAIPALRETLFAREPSGLYQARCRAAEALALIGAHDVLIEFLQTAHAAADPVERLGDDAVVNAAARLLVGRTEETVFELLLDPARRPCLTGVLAALASFRRPEAIPRLVASLADDASRPTAERALNNSVLPHAAL